MNLFGIVNKKVVEGIGVCTRIVYNLLATSPGQVFNAEEGLCIRDNQVLRVTGGIMQGCQQVNTEKGVPRSMHVVVFVGPDEYCSRVTGRG